MKPSTWFALEQVLEKVGDQETGKVVQKLLAIAFRRLGFERVVERSTQGVDLDVARGDERYAIEVKTAQGWEVSLDPKDIKGPPGRHYDRYQAVMAVLRLSPEEDWILARMHPGVAPFAKGKHAAYLFRATSIVDLEREVRQAFAAAVAEHHDAALEGQAGLQPILDEAGVQAP